MATGEMIGMIGGMLLRQSKGPDSIMGWRRVRTMTK
jgi:hypothetical protein